MSKRIQLCGLGNSIVDLQYMVSDSDISKLGLEKGSMTLVDPAIQADLIRLFSYLQPNRCSGGSAANSIIAFSALGGKAAYQSKLGKDDLGKFYAEELRKLGIELHSDFIEGDSTGVSLILITPDAERTMLTSLGASASFNADDLNERVIADSEWLYIEGYKLTLEDGFNACVKACKAATKAKTKIAISFSDTFITELFQEQLKEIVKHSDLVFCNKTEALNFTKKEVVSEAIFELHKLVDGVVLTLGDKGALISEGGKTIEIPSIEVKAIDTTGAGDMFAGTYLYGITQGYGLQNSGRLAIYASGLIVSQMGARLNYNYDKLKAESINK